MLCRPSISRVALARISFFAGGLIRSQHTDVPPRRLLSVYDSFLNGAGNDYVENLYYNYTKDPHSVDESWAEIFEKSKKIADLDQGLMTETRRPATDAANVSQTLLDCCRLTWIIQAFEDKGHLVALTDPLISEDLPMEARPCRRAFEPTRLDLEYFGYSPTDFNRKVRVGFMEDVGGLLSSKSEIMTLQQLHEYLKKTYCGTIGYEFGHIMDRHKQRYLRDAIEVPSSENGSPFHLNFSAEDRLHFLRTLCNASLWEIFLESKYPEDKTFGIRGGESFILGMDALLERLSLKGVEGVVCGMSHRGKLNALVNLFQKPVEAVFKEMNGLKKEDLEPYGHYGDINANLGAYTKHKFGRQGNMLEVDLVDSPAHCEACNPYVQGRTKAMQNYNRDVAGHRFCPIEVHGDASFSGQGVCFENASQAEIPMSHTGGTIHVIINNQVGNTGDAKSGKSKSYCTDVGLAYQYPILHVNGDKPEDVVRCFQFAADYRQKFHSSIIIDLVCYKRGGAVAVGSNDSKLQPTSLSRPTMFSAVEKKSDVFTMYAKEKVQDALVHKKDIDNMTRETLARFETVYEQVNEKGFDYSTYLKSRVRPQWEGTANVDQNTSAVFEPTGVTKEDLQPVIKALGKIPAGYKLHPSLEKTLLRRQKTLEEGTGIEWATAEALAMGTLCQEGIPVHIYGQDVERATFSQRNFVLHDQNTNNVYTQLQNISPEQAEFHVINSELAEYAPLGFEVGYASYTPRALCMWEAQFGDFANGAQVVFDQFISSGEAKWNQPNGVIVSMPHGFDGQGPEHSSGRPERFLQLAHDDERCLKELSPAERVRNTNMIISCLTTPAQYFHLLRRHVKGNVRKPLLNFFSKNFLRTVAGTKNTSDIGEFMGKDKHFQEVILDEEVLPKNAKRLVMCSGQVFHKLYQARNAAGADGASVALVRIEQLCPFPVKEVRDALKVYSSVDNVVWAQEEPQNMGFWWYVQPRIEAASCGVVGIGKGDIKGCKELIYAGRVPSASPATGYKYAHQYEQDAFCATALGLEISKN